MSVNKACKDCIHWDSKDMGLFDSEFGNCKKLLTDGSGVTVYSTKLIATVETHKEFYCKNFIKEGGSDER